MPYDIGFYLLDRGNTRWTELLNEFADPLKRRHVAKQTFSNYLKELRKEGLIQKFIDPATDRVAYKISEKGKTKLQEELLKREAKTIIDQLPPKQVKGVIQNYAIYAEVSELYKLYTREYGTIGEMTRIDFHKNWNFSSFKGPFSDSRRFGEEKPKIVELYDKMLLTTKKHRMPPEDVPLIQVVKKEIEKLIKDINGYFKDVALETEADSYREQTMYQNSFDPSDAYL